MIRVRDLNKSYPTRFGTKTVLDGVNFELAMGERLGILGRNGAGKSTMIRLVSGAERPTSGVIERDMSVSWPLAFGGAFQPQLTGVDNIRFITSIYNQDFDRNLEFVEDFAELGPYLREPVRSYSSGMRARLAFAISMIIEFDCFLIDEIGAVGDARFHDRCNHELFEVRGDRAMIIISHDAGYVRDHCNRWAILHDTKLTHFDDFEEAYGVYKELIGAEMRAKPVSIAYTNRARMIESSQRAALTDERFRIHVQQGDWARDQRDWKKAQREYADALALYPYQRSYWTQHAHAAKEQDLHPLAEISYRTAAALGEPLADLEDHAAFVIAQQGDADIAPPPRTSLPGMAAVQPPARADYELMAWLFQSEDDPQAEDILSALRDHASCDEMAAALIDSASFAAVTWGGVADVETTLLKTAGCLFGENLSHTARERLTDEITPGDDVIASLAKAGAFAQWPRVRNALNKHYPQLHDQSRERMH